MTFDVYDTLNNRWVDLTPYFKYQGFEGSRNDVDGPAAGRVLEQAKMFRDRLATKYKFTVTSIPLPNSTALVIERLLMPEFFQVRTDYYSTTVQSYTVYSNNVVKAYVIYKGYDMVKLSFPIVEQ